jgi:hypothetical protein
MPKNLLSQAATDLLSKTISLSQCPTLPDQLLAELLRDTEAFLNGEL